MASLAVIVAHAYPHVSNYCADTLLALNISEKIELGHCLVNVRFPKHFSH